MTRNCECVQEDGYPPAIGYRSDPVTLKLIRFCEECGVEIPSTPIPDYRDLPVLSGW